MLLSSHLLGEVQQVCDRVAVVASGRLVAEGTVDELRGAAELHLVVTPVTDAVTHARRLVAPAPVEVVDGTLRLPAEGVDAGALNRALVDAGVTVSELRRVERSLEDAFLSMTDDSPRTPVEA